MKTMKHFLSMAALALVGAMMTGCTNEDNVADQPENKSRVVTMTTTISLDGAAATRALDASGHKTFKAGEYIAVFYEDTEGDSYLASGDDGVALTNISADGKTASFTVTLTDPKPNGKLRYVYPAYLATDVATDDDINDDDNTIDWQSIEDFQYGTLSDLEQCSDLAVFDGTLTAEGTLPTSATLVNKLAVLAIKFKDGSTDVTANIKVLEINEYYIEVNGGTAYWGGQSTIYVAIRPTSNAAITVSAWDDQDADVDEDPAKYTKNLTGKTYAAGNWYNVTWQVGTPAPALLSVTITDTNGYMGGDKEIFYAEGETWAEAIANHATENAGWDWDEYGVYRDGTTEGLVYDLTTGNCPPGNYTIYSSHPYEYR